MWLALFSPARVLPCSAVRGWGWCRLCSARVLCVCAGGAAKRAAREVAHYGMALKPTAVAEEPAEGGAGTRGGAVGKAKAKAAAGSAASGLSLAEQEVLALRLLSGGR